jgi:hypothetical protein
VKATTVHDEMSLSQECRRLYEIDARSDPKAAERYLAAIEDIDAALSYIDAHPNAWQTLDAATEKQVCEVLDKLTEEGLEFSRSRKKGKQQ